MYLPPIGGGGQSVEDELESPGNESTAAAGPAKEGLIYPGPLPIRSDTPQPTNRLQTLLQLELEDLPIVNPRLDFLNLFPMPEVVRLQWAAPLDTVKPEEPQPVERSDSVATELIQPEFEDLPILNPSLDFLDLLPMPEVVLVQPVEPPDPPVGLPDAVKPEQQQPLEPSDGVATEPIQPAVEPQPPTPIHASKPVVPARLPSHKRDLRNILALTPLPTWREQPVEIPAGEALARFTISPEPNLDTSETEPGSPSPVVLENETVDQAGENAAVENSAPVITLTFGSSGDAVPDSGPGIDSDRGADSSPSTGALAGLTIVGGVGGIETSGWGADSSPSTGALAGLTILGGVGGTGASVNSLPDSRVPPPRQTRYGVFVVSTENSGGGLPYFGVFSNAQINTVYLDMRQNETDAAPFWTLEFAVPGGTAIQANPPGELDGSHEGLVLPVPIVKEQPALPLLLVSRHIGKMIIVYSVVNAEGKMEQISVKESPDPLLNQPVLDALSKWVFRPGVLNGDPVAVKALLGIPLWPVLSD